MRLKRILRFLLVVAILVALWFAAAAVVRSAWFRRNAAEHLADVLSVDAVTIGASSLRFPCTVSLTEVQGTVGTEDAPPVFTAKEIRSRCCSWRVESPVIIARKLEGGNFVPLFLNPQPVADFLEGRAPLCPMRFLATVGDAWELGSEWGTVRNATLSYRTADGSVRPVFVGLTWTRSPLRIGKHGRVIHSTARWLAYGAATEPDGRPNDGRPGEIEWLGGKGVPLQPLWGPQAPCAPQRESEGPEVPKSEGPEVPKSEGPEVPKSEGLEVPESESPEVPESESPEVPESEGPEVPESEGPEVPESENPKVEKSVSPAS